MALPRIRYVAMGGTISSTASGTGVIPQLGSAEIAASVPGLDEIAEVDPSDFPKYASFVVTPANMLALAHEVNASLAAGCDGVVITHGTDTLEETAYMLALTVPRGAPVVVTGAMRNASMVAPEGPANLLNAFQVAASPFARGLGPLVVLNEELHAARFATKTHTSKASTFVSTGGGPLGETIEGRVDVWWRPAWDDYLGLPESVDGLNVELVRVAAGPTPTQLEAVVASKPDGIVIEGTGGGHVPPPLLPALDEAVAAGIPVVTASRGLAGAVLEGTYGMEGGEMDLIRRGALPVGRLAGHKARLRLLVGCSLGLDPRSLFPLR